MSLGETQGGGGRKASKATVKLTRVIPVIPANLIPKVRHQSIVVGEDEVSEGTEIYDGDKKDYNAEDFLIPLPSGVAGEFDKLSDKLMYSTQGPSKKGHDSQRGKEEANKKVDTDLIFEKINFEEAYDSIPLDRYSAPPQIPVKDSIHRHHSYNDPDKLRDGGLVTVNGRGLSEYFTDPLTRHDVIAPLIACGVCGEYDISCNTKGGGSTGQAQAIRLAISRALVAQDPLYRATLKSHGFLTRDSRVVERKKPGRKKARKSFQWVKR